MDKSLPILYVEDDALSRQIFELMLTRVVGCTNLRMWENSLNFGERLNEMPQSPALIFLDIHVEPLNGFEMIQIIRSQPRTSEAIVIALTASLVSEEMVRLRHAGFNGAIGKPLDIRRISEVFGRILKREPIWLVR